MIRAATAAAFSIILLVSQATAVTAAPPPASDLIDSAWLHSEDSAIVHVDPDLEVDGHAQTYLVESGETEIDFTLDVSGDGGDEDLYDSFTIELVGATFPAASYAASVVVDGTGGDDDDCAVSWNVAGLATGTLIGTIDCRGADGIDSEATIPLVIESPETGSAIIAVDTTGEDFSSFMFVAEPGDEILVGMDAVEGGDAACPAPDFSTDAAAQGSIEAALEAAFVAVDDANDVIVICDTTGEYTYTDSFKTYDLTADGWDNFYPSITVRAETVGGVLLNGDAHQFFSLVGADLSLSGITFVGGAALSEFESLDYLGFSPITVVVGDLQLEQVNLFQNIGWYGGGALVWNGTLSAQRVRAEENAGLIGGALSVINLPYSEEGFELTTLEVSESVFDSNCSTSGGNAIFSYLASESGLVDNVIVDNTYCGEEFPEFEIFSGGAVYALGGDTTIIGGTFSGNKARRDEDLGEDYGGAVTVDACDVIDDDFPDWLDPFCANPSLTIKQSVFEGNESGHGGAVSARGIDVLIERTRFGRDVQSSCGVTPKVGYANEASYGGGAIFAADSNLTVRSSQFYRNCGWAIASGGAIAAIESDITVTGSRFAGNSAESGGAVYHASAAPTPYSRVLIEQNQFIGNLANIVEGQGGAVRITFANSKTALISNVFTANRAAQGGAVSLNDGYGEGFEDPVAYRWRVERNTFTSNVAVQDGGALHMALDNSGLVVPNGVRRNTFSRNSAVVGGAVVVESDSGSERQILTRFQRALRDNRFAGNRATRARNTADIGVHFD